MSPAKHNGQWLFFLSILCVNPRLFCCTIHLQRIKDVITIIFLTKNVQKLLFCNCPKISENTNSEFFFKKNQSKEIKMEPS